MGRFFRGAKGDIGRREAALNQDLVGQLSGEDVSECVLDRNRG